VRSGDGRTVGKVGVAELRQLGREQDTRAACYFYHAQGINIKQQKYNWLIKKISFAQQKLFGTLARPKLFRIILKVDPTSFKPFNLN